MPAIPKVVFLYDNDALEVRYSDDSRLELSPCGAAMVFHPPTKPGEHPRHRLSQQLHKRTQFVTSEHRLKVLQALDFRNRFAKRPYLCEDLLNSQDVVSLYASVDHAKWPKSPTQAKIYILPDGSRKLTSLDEFSSLIVSPHGQDFSVCYLSKISSENGSFSSPQPSSPPYVPVHTSKHALGRGSHKKASEAVVYPYSHEQNEYVDETQTRDKHHDKGSGVHLTASKQENDQNTKRHCHQNHEEHHGGNIAKQSSHFPNENFVCQQHGCQAYTQGCSEIALLTHERNSNLQNVQPSSDVQSGSLPASLVQSPLNSLTSQVDGKATANDRCSPLPHEISSISRSSSPDGLRMTIDSDTTLTHDTTDNETIRYRQRHSSPTQMCSDLDDIQLPFARLVELKSSLVQGSCSSFPSDNQHQLSFAQACHLSSGEPPTPSQGNALSISSVFEMAKSSKQLTHSHADETCNSDSSHSNTLHDSQQDKSPNGQEIHDKEDTVQKPDSENCPVHTISGDQADGVIRPVQRSCPSNKSGHFTAAIQEEQVSSNQSRGDSVPPYHLDKPQCTALPLVEVPVQSTCLKSKEERVPGIGEEKRMKIPFSSPSASSNVDSELENKSLSKRKYIWTTSHASRNDCPKEWTHALMLALQGTSTVNAGEPEGKSPSSQRDNRGCCASSLPKPLPLNCPFQHTHRSAPSQNDDGDQNQSSDFISNVGIFQRGRLKVVLSEGIIYRLIPASGMTVVEVYPGDGSVLISQGAKALFFTHYIPRQGQLEERMYSLKSLPPRCSKEFRPIEKMLKTANRFLHICLSWDKRTDKRYPPCWQKEMVAVVEPLPSSILEECVIDGLGKFTAYTNGRVRIVFDDRTSLNMMADFSPRIGPATKIPNSDLEDQTVRLLLPSGNYVLLEKNSSGPYSRYLKMACEWTDWVNTSPSERHRFYTQQNQPAMLDQAAKLELKKINCFNYILENTFQPIQQQNQAMNLPSSVDFSTSCEKLITPHPHFKTDILPSATLSVSPHFDHNLMSHGHGSTSVSPSNVDKNSFGFLSVKQALAQTSSLIRDIEDFLEDNKT